MPRVLLLARHFPPIGGAGVHRTLGSVRHLPEHGYELVVVTGPASHRNRWSPHDDELLNRVPEGTEVHRVEGPEPTPRTGLAARLEALGRPPAPWIRWWIEQSVRLGREVGAGADLVLASCLPYETALAGARLAAELGTPWVADLEDPWALDEMWAFPTGVHRRLEMRRMRAALSSASAIVMAAPEAAARLSRALPEAAPATGIPIGFEPADFAQPAPAPGDHVFRIVHTGSLHTDFGLRLRSTRTRRRLLGGTVAGVDPLTRSHVFLVEALDALIAADPSLESRVELHLAGELTARDRAVSEDRSYVRTPGLLTHRETVDLMRSADLLFLPMHDLPAGERAGLIPYKTYEYLAAERPILAAVPDGDVRDMLAPLDHVSLVRPTDIAGMTAAVSAQIASGRVTQVAQGIDSPALQSFDRSESVARIAGVLDGALARSRPHAPVAA